MYQILAAEPHCWSATEIGETTLDDLDLMFNPVEKHTPGGIEFDSIEEAVAHIAGRKTGA